MENCNAKVCKKNPKENANFLSKLFFCWILGLFREGARKDLELSDLYRPLQTDQSKDVGDSLEREWELELKKFKNRKVAKPSLAKAIARTFGLQYLQIGIFTVVYALVCRTLQPLFQGWVIAYFSATNAAGHETQENALIYAAGLVTCVLCGTFAIHHMNINCQQLGMRIRVACSSLIYRKSLRLSKFALTKTAPGQIINLMSNDVNRFDQVFLYLHFLWVGPIQMLIVGYIMWHTAGPPVIAGLACFLLCTVPLQGYLSKLARSLRKSIAMLTDERIQFMSELINGIQVIKMYAWEKAFVKIVADIRKREITTIRYGSYIRAIYTSFVVITERLTLFVTLVTFVLLGNVLSPPVSFTLASFFNVLQATTVLFVPQALAMGGETMVSIKRIEEFLTLEEITQNQGMLANNLAQEKPNLQKNSDIYIIGKNEKNADKKSDEIMKPSHYERESVGVGIRFHRVSANWTSGKLPPTICSLSMTINSKELCALIGPVGSGKSSVLHLLLKELPIGAGSLVFKKDTDEDWTNFLKNAHNFLHRTNNGSIFVCSSTIQFSYASQEPWIFRGTVKDNILFGQNFDADRYNEVIKVCSLTRDLKQLPEGDLTIIGDRGASLSGGQRARINLARAIYRKADVYLLDDPLSAVDTRVAKDLFNKCIVEYLKGKTRVLVTHQLQFLNQADNIVFLDGGTVKYQGNYDQLMESPDFNDMLQSVKLNHRTANNEDSSYRNNAVSKSVNKKSRFLIRQVSLKSSDSSSCESDDERDSKESKQEEETSVRGQLSNKVVKTYWLQSGGFRVIVTVLMMIISQVSLSGNDYWLTFWTNISDIKTRIDSNDTSITDTERYLLQHSYDTLKTVFFLKDEDLATDDQKQYYFIYVYTICIASCVFLNLLRGFLVMNVCMQASKLLHNKMFSTVVETPMRFFHTNPSGRILNRFSKDVGAMDELLPVALMQCLQIMFVVLGILFMILLVNIWMAIPIVVAAFLFFWLRKYFLKTAQDVKRLEGVAKSPVFSHVNATLNGLTTIRSRGNEIVPMLRKQFDEYQDVHSGAWYLIVATSVAFGFTLDLICCVFVACVCFSFILSDQGDTMGGNVGLAITQSIILTGMLQYGVRQSAEVVSQFTAVERIMQYIDLPREGPGVSSPPLPPNWPSKGRIVFKNLSMSYNKDQPAVLQNLNLKIEPGWKVGVVGRTGAGKSSLISALFRLAGEGLEGEIRIDGRDTKTVGLSDLRSALSIIPQEPVLFSQSLRYNLDPFGKYEDAVLWNVLKEVEMNEHQLDAYVSEGGSNFSVGERQLICLARAILGNNKILVLDEATANIDAGTDAVIQKTVRQKFQDCTVFTVAHRLNTIIDSDRILVMNNGRMVEFGCPFDLLRDKPTGYFSEMVKRTGKTMSLVLYQHAEMACRRNLTQRSLELNDNESTDFADDCTENASDD